MIDREGDTLLAKQLEHFEFYRFKFKSLNLVKIKSISAHNQRRLDDNRWVFKQSKEEITY